MKTFIIQHEDFIPIALEEGMKCEYFNKDLDDYDRRVELSKETQFRPEYLTSKELLKHYMGNRLRQFYFYKGLVFNSYECLVAVLGKDGKVAVSKDWARYYPAEFKRLKTSLKTLGYNTREDKCFTFLYDLQDIFFKNILSPTMKDYEEERQLTLSSEFIALERGKVNTTLDDATELGFVSGENLVDISGITS